ncbi:hypothetical protein BJX61DRAFT_410954 [Aspergillus egyptiacus]|nr:hypothetical protein BJX61DRAFT_410954 [Aspergillus egyptiacus]
MPYKTWRDSLGESKPERKTKLLSRAHSTKPIYIMKLQAICALGLLITVHAAPVARPAPRDLNPSLSRRDKDGSDIELEIDVGGPKVKCPPAQPPGQGTQEIPDGCQIGEGW